MTKIASYSLTTPGYEKLLFLIYSIVLNKKKMFYKWIVFYLLRKAGGFLLLLTYNLKNQPVLFRI